jgi:hypothetical protein
MGIFGAIAGIAGKALAGVAGKVIGGIFKGKKKDELPTEEDLNKLAKEDPEKLAKLTEEDGPIAKLAQKALDKVDWKPETKESVSEEDIGNIVEKIVSRLMPPKVDAPKAPTDIQKPSSLPALPPPKPLPPLSMPTTASVFSTARSINPMPTLQQAPTQAALVSSPKLKPAFPQLSMDAILRTAKPPVFRTLPNL